MTSYIAPLIVLGATLALVVALYLLGRVLAVTRRALRTMPFQGGGPPREHAVSRFHVRWFAVSLMLLAFDMEMIFMYPWTLVVRVMGAPSVIEMFAFLALLVIGVLYAWREGAFRWT